MDQLFSAIDNECLTISQLNQLIRDVLNMGFPNTLWICGEIQGFNRNKDKKHIFFELCEKDPASKDIVARISLVIFEKRRMYIEEILKSSENAFDLKDDIEVKFLCKVDFYPPHGAIRLIVESIDPVYTLGKIAQEKQKLIALLKKNGVLDKNKERELPLVPLHVGLITAYDSAAYNDFLSELQISGYGFRVYHRNALMQGKATAQDVCKALDMLENIACLDVIVITRGGGSIADLSWFDNQKIAERIASCRLPVLSGIGHEINITVTDLAAHTYQKTPTAIARFLVERVETFITELEEKLYGIVETTRQKIDDEKKSLKQAAFDLHSRTTLFLKSHYQQITQFAEILRRQPLKYLRSRSQKLVDKNKELEKALKIFLHQQETKIRHYARIVEIASPQNTLRRGFSITRAEDGTVVGSVMGMAPGKKIKTELVDGLVHSRVEKWEVKNA